MSKYINPIRRGDGYLIHMDLLSLFASTDLTGAVFTFTLKNSLDDLDANAVLQFSSTAGDNVNDNLINKIIVLDVPSAATAALPIDQAYFWDVQCKLAGGETITVLPPIAIDAKTNNPVLDRTGRVDYDKVYVVGDATRT